MRNGLADQHCKRGNEGDHYVDNGLALHVPVHGIPTHDILP